MNNINIHECYNFSDFCNRDWQMNNYMLKNSIIIKMEIFLWQFNEWEEWKIN